MRRIHDTQPPEPGLAREDFTSHLESCSLVRQAQEIAKLGGHTLAVELDLAAMFEEKFDEVAAIVWRAEALGWELKDRIVRGVVCHADIHLGNLLVDAADGLHLVDWEQSILAPIERDIVFFTEGAFGTTQREEELFAEGYGDFKTDPLLMAYYRYSRAVEDLSGFAREILFPDCSEESKQDALRWLKNLFRPRGLYLSSAQRW